MTLYYRVKFVFEKKGYSWDYAKDIEPTYKQVMSSPSVGDLDGDGKAEIVFTSYLDREYNGKGVLRVLSGATGIPKFSVSAEGLQPYASTTPLIVDLDHDGKAEIIYLHASRTKVIALNFDGSLRWEIPFGLSAAKLPKALEIDTCHHGFSAAKLNDNGRTQILAGGYIIEEDSFRVPQIKKAYQGAYNVSCTSFAASLSSIPGSDLSIIDKFGVPNKDGTRQFLFRRAGFPATADLMPEVPGIEIVVTGDGYLTIYNGLTGETLVDKTLSEHSEIVCSSGMVGGGQASIGHFSGHANQLEIAVATGRSLTIFNNQGDIVAGKI